MKKGLSRFTFHLEQIEGLLDKAMTQKNPAMWLFTNNARTPFFMLEGLAKVYSDIHNPKVFGKLQKHFKLIEDGLGQIDYYQSLSKELEAKKLVPANCKQYIKNQIGTSAEHLNGVLKYRGWFSDDNKRLSRISDKLKKAAWLKPAEELKAISGFYKTSIASITKFVAETDYHFDNVEEDVHELRRKLRWLSIYPQAFRGAFQYAEDSKQPVHLNKYLTKEIIDSPYNKLPAAGNNTTFLLINRNYFLALSWMIAQLGSLKDEGLLLTGLCEAISHCTPGKEDEISVKAETMLGNNQRKMQLILDDAESITRTYFKEKNLQKLIL